MIQSPLDFSKIPECDLIVNYVNTRFSKKGMGTTIYVIGLPGTGKSSTCQRIAELISNSRENEPHIFIVDSLLKFLDALMRSQEGDIIIIEEVSVLFPSRRAMAEENLTIGKVLDTFRKKRLCLIANCPIWNSVDSHMRAMGNILIETLRINKTLGIVISKFHRLQTNPSSGKTYRHTMLREGKDVNRMYTRMPNLKRWNEYEKEKTEFMERLYRQLKHKAKKKEDKIAKEMEVIKPRIRNLTERELQVHQLLNVQGLTQREVAKKLGIHQTRIAQIKKNLLKKSRITEKS